MAGLTPEDSIFGNKASSNSKSPPKGMLAPAPYAHTANQQKFGKMASGAPFSAIKFKDGFAESAADASQTHKT